MGVTRRQLLLGAGGVVVGATGLLAGGCALRSGQARGPAVAVLRDSFPGIELATTDAVIGRLRQAGLAVDVLDGAEVGDASRLTASNYRALVLGDARLFPAAAVGALSGYLHPGSGAPGNLVALGGPFLSDLQYKVGGQWGPRSAALAQAVPQGTPLSIPPVQSWQAAGNTASSNVSVASSGGELTFRIPDLQGWGNTNVAASFPANHTLTTFEAKGSGETGCFILEWDERDGARWIATVHITGSWQPYVLAPQDFVYWPSPPVAGRGGPGDYLHTANAIKLSVGVDTAHCGSVSGPQSFSIRDLGTLPPSVAPQLASATVPVLTGLAPLPAGDAYEAYVIPEAVQLQLESGQRVVTGLPGVGSASGAISPVYRPRGLGMVGTQSAPPYRFIPVVTARGTGGALRGAPGAVFLHGSGPAAGAGWILLGLPPDLLQSASGYAAEFTAQALAWVLQGSWLFSAGAQAASAAASQAVPLGASVLLHQPADRVTVQFSLAGKQVAQQQIGPPAAGTLYQAVPQARVAHGLSLAQVTAGATAPAATGAATLTVELLSQGKPLDTISYPLRVYSGASTGTQPLITVGGGEFLAGGKPFRPVGINYWPRSTSGVRPELFTQGWLSPLLYDPDVVEADLTVMSQLGFNLVNGIQYYVADQAPALRDFLARCDAHGIRANVSVTGGSPLGPDVQTLTGLISGAQLQQEGAVFAYDLAWEPHVGTFTTRARQLSDPWIAWVNDQYGSLARAQTAWGYTGGAQGPEDAQLLQSGAWDVMVAAYRRFLDDYVTAGYGQVWRAIRGLGDNHLLGARTGYGGTGQMGVVTQMPLDLQSGTLYVDFTSPEGYGLGPAYAQTVAGGLTTAYGRAAGGGKPVFWAEWGLTIWSDPASLESAQGQLYQSIYQMIAASAANGGTGWWFPGGYRVNEGSDFGIFNPDGTPRASAQAVSQAARQLAAQGAVPAPDVWIAVDRDRYVQGYAGVWAAQGPAYAQELAAGHLPGVLLPGSGTTSENCPLTAVGGGQYPGFGPLQALNAAFVRVRVGGADVAAGGKVQLPASLEVTLGNTAPAAWTGNVALSVTLPDGTVQSVPLPQAQVPYLQMVTLTGIPLPAVQGTVVLGVQARGRAAFGPTFQLQA